jgi:hypothetical protein
VFVIAEPYARFEASVEQELLERAATDLQSFAEGILKEHFGERYATLRIAIVVRVEVGSSRVWITVGSVITVLTLYGSIRRSVDYLTRDARHIGDMLLTHVGHSLNIGDSPRYCQRRSGVPGRIRGLFEKVENGQLSAEETTDRALGIIYQYSDSDAAREIPELASRLSSEFEGTEGDRLPQERRGRGPREVLGLPSQTPPRRRRGVVASRGPSTGDLLVRRY